MSRIEDERKPQPEPRGDEHQSVTHTSAATLRVSSAMIAKAEVLTPDLAAFVTATSSAANAVIDLASAELTKRITKQIEEMEKERQAPHSLPSQK